jgi:hypothetical protein
MRKNVERCKPPLGVRSFSPPAPALYDRQAIWARIDISPARPLAHIVLLAHPSAAFAQRDSHGQAAVKASSFGDRAIEGGDSTENQHVLVGRRSSLSWSPGGAIRAHSDPARGGPRTRRHWNGLAVSASPAGPAGGPTLADCGERHRYGRSQFGVDRGEPRRRCCRLGLCVRRIHCISQCAGHRSTASAGCAPASHSGSCSPDRELDRLAARVGRVPRISGRRFRHHGRAGASARSCSPARAPLTPLGPRSCRQRAAVVMR